jgi:DNA adenine methylase
MTKQDSINIIQNNYGISHVLAHTIVNHYGAKQAIDKTEQYLRDKPRPFVKWVGGKRQLLAQFKEKELYPPQDFDPSRAKYHEPFVGGGALFFDMLPPKASITDMNEELIITYRVTRDEPNKLIAKLKEHKRKNNKEYFLKVRAQNTARLSDVSRAARFIYLNKTAFNGLYRVNSKGQFNVPYGKYTNPNIADEENLLAVSEALQKTKITHGSYRNVLKQAKKGDFIYFDPPYYPVSKTANFTSYTKDAFLEKEQEELRDVFVELHNRGCFVMLSNSDTSFIRDLYSNICDSIKIHTVEAGRAINSNASKRGKITEVVVTNY